MWIRFVRWTVDSYQVGYGCYRPRVCVVVPGLLFRRPGRSERVRYRVSGLRTTNGSGRTVVTVDSLGGYPDSDPDEWVVDGCVDRRWKYNVDTRTSDRVYQVTSVVVMVIRVKI